MGYTWLGMQKADLGRSSAETREGRTGRMFQTVR